MNAMPKPLRGYVRTHFGRIRPTAIAYHRNGTSGNGFHVVTFDQASGKSSEPFVAVVFAEPGNVAVFQNALLAQGVIAFGANSWRGDDYEPTLRLWIAAWERAENERVLGKEAADRLERAT